MNRRAARLAVVLIALLVIGSTAACSSDDDTSDVDSEADGGDETTDDETTDDDEDEAVPDSEGTAVVIIEPALEGTEAEGTFEVPIESCQDLGGGVLNITGTSDDEIGLRVTGAPDAAGVYVMGPGGHPYAGAEPVAVTVGDGVTYEGANDQGLQTDTLEPLGGTFSIAIACTPERP